MIRPVGELAQLRGGPAHPAGEVLPAPQYLPGPSRGGRPPGGRRRHRRAVLALTLLGVAVVTSAVVAWATGGLARVTNGQPSSGSAAARSSSLAAVQADLRAAVRATVWPDPRPDFHNTGAKENHGCAWHAFNPIAQCTWGNPSASHTLYLVGDSTSAAY